ncbi:MAG: hypothetical protein KF740_11525 [Ramlibacter sp.]|nr:hypothetical protein [Ramlibacter sp.]
MKLKLLTLALATSCVWAGAVHAMSKDEFTAQKDRIEADYKAGKERCASLKANARDICLSEAKGVEKVAKADLEARYKPSASANEKLALARADAAYDTARERCDDLAGNAKDVCIKDAKAAHVSARGAAKVGATRAEGAHQTADARKDAEADTLAARYDAAVERCDALAGQARVGCVNDAKRRFGKT